MNGKIAKWQLILSVITAIGVIVGVVGVIGNLVYNQFQVKSAEMNKPNLIGDVFYEHWMIPFNVNEELKGMEKISQMCGSLKKVEVADKLKGKNEAADKLKETLSKLNLSISEINGEFKRLEPCDINNVKQLKSQYYFSLKNNGGKVCEDIRIIFKDAKYIEFKISDGEKQKTNDQGYALIGDLYPSVGLNINVWATCPINKPEYIITSKDGTADITVN